MIKFGRSALYERIIQEKVRQIGAFKDDLDLLKEAARYDGTNWIEVARTV